MRSEQRTFTEDMRRRQIVDCAIELIAEIGYPQASLSKIGERASIAKSVVLYHFKGKHELVAAIVETVFTASATVMVPRLSAAQSPTHRLIAYIESNGEFLDRHRAEAVALYEISTSYRTADGLRLDQAAQRSVEAEGVPEVFALLDPESIFADGIREEEFHTSASPRDLKNALRAALDGAVTEMARDDDYDVLTYTNTVRDLFLTAMGVQR
ncbi:TetR/AcrR family transcriptional regulator [Gordonia westfalica]|uniref:TetR/AcrR family transcriptional regulator n=1 Tax=Gordonia westfalica TaxID=158898 RepID=A0ABU2GZI1_9ACTN|nr:TetR/AcrR family transcriptional regulator [Gordonia westfalica]MDS1116872.1 TetR/AcrR family transcriptional regulator [Gordonia westfalica]